MRNSNKPDFAAAVKNAGWYVRNSRRGSAQRRQALQRLTLTLRAALEEPEPEPALYAVAEALYDRKDPRFQV